MECIDDSWASFDFDFQDKQCLFRMEYYHDDGASTIDFEYETNRVAVIFSASSILINLKDISSPVPYPSINAVTIKAVATSALTIAEGT